MQIVYPKGSTGEILGNMIEFVRGNPPRFIDDSICGGGLLDCKEEILKSGNPILLAWDKKSGWNDITMQSIIGKLQDLKIPYIENAMEQYANELVLKLKNQVLRKNPKYCVGIELGGMAEDKHIGILDDKLVEIFGDEVLIVYFCGRIESYRRIIQKIEFKNLNAIAVCLSPYDLELVDFVDILCKVSWTQKNSSVRTIEIGHSMNDFSQYPIDNYHHYFDYLCITRKDFYPQRESMRVQCVKSGYLAFDRTCVEFSGGGGILFDAYNEYEFFIMLPLIKMALKKYNVRFRARFFTQGSHWKKVEKDLATLNQNTNFIIDNSWKMSLESYQETFLLVCGATTMRNTFPLLTLCPSLVLSNKSDVLNENLGVTCELDIKPEEFLRQVEMIESAKEIWKKKILNYRESYVYNFGCASDYLANFIANCLKEKV